MNLYNSSVSSETAQAVVFAFGLPIVVLAWFFWKSRQLTVTDRWPAIEARVQSAQVEVVSSSRAGDIHLPVFDFSYRVEGKSYFGRFTLVPTIETAQTLMSRVRGKAFPVKYNPRKPSIFYIPSAQIEGAEVYQRYGNVLLGFAPRNERISG
jgi:hypothetical protein